MKINILHITKMRGVSGSENHLLTLLPTLDRNRFQVQLCILAEARHVEAIQEYKHTLEQAGIAVSVLIIHKYIDLLLIQKLWRLMRQTSCQIVHTHLIHADLYGTLAAKFARVPVIISSRHNDDRFRQQRLSIWLNRMLAHWQTKIVVISDWVGQFLQRVEQIPADKIVRIHYGLDPTAIRAQRDPQYVRRQLQIPPDAPVIGTIGQLAEQKGQLYLLHAVKHVMPQFPALRVVIIGKGALSEDLKRQAKILGIEQNVIFTGYRTDAIKLLSGFDLFVFPSLWEGFGLVLLEAMALEKAIVASRVSAIPESVVDGQTGLLVPAQNPDQLAEALARLLKSPELAQHMGRAGYERLTQHFSVPQMVSATETLYNDLTGFQNV